MVRASAMLRLYTALRGIAGLKLSEDEVACLLEMITCKPPVTSAGVKFASLGLSVLIACNSLIGSPENEKVNILKNKVHSVHCVLLIFKLTSADINQIVSSENI